MNKMFTATAILRLAERQIDLTSPRQSTSPIPEPRCRDEGNDTPLLTHTAAPETSLLPSTTSIAWKCTSSRLRQAVWLARSAI